MRLSNVRQRCKYVVCDYATSSVAFFIFNICRYYLLKGESGVGYDDSLWEYVFSEKLLIEQVLIPMGMLGIYWLSGYYNIPFGKSRLQELITTLFSALFNSMLIYLVLLINDQTGRRTINYELIGTLVASLFFFTYIGRALLTSSATTRFRHHTWEFRTLIIGNSQSARDAGRKLSEAKSRSMMKVVGYLEIPGETGIRGEVPAFPLEMAEQICKELEIDQIVIPAGSYTEERVLGLLYRMFHLEIPIKIAPDTLSYVTSAIRLQDILGEPFIDLTAPAISESSKNIKRMMDVAVSVLALVFLSPVYLLLAVLVKMDSRGPAFYSQERIGRKQKPFMIYKYRTMSVDAEREGPALSEFNDPRITRMGRILRKYRLDELPQFWNVLKGEMSIVGPRPERRFFIEQIMRKAPYYTLVYQVRPGITSWGMVKYGYASNVEEMVERTRYDLIYLTNMSLFVDLKILIYTVKTVLTGRGI